MNQKIYDEATLGMSDIPSPGWAESVGVVCVLAIFLFVLPSVL